MSKRKSHTKNRGRKETPHKKRHRRVPKHHRHESKRGTRENE